MHAKGGMSKKYHSMTKGGYEKLSGMMARGEKPKGSYKMKSKKEKGKY